MGWGALVGLEIMMGWHSQHMTGTMTGGIIIAVLGHTLVDGGTITATVHT